MIAAMLGGWEIFLIVAVMFLFFGADKLPKLCKGITQSVREFKKAATEGKE